MTVQELAWKLQYLIEDGDVEPEQIVKATWFTWDATQGDLIKVEIPEKRG